MRANSFGRVLDRRVAGDEKFRIWDSYWRDSRLYSAGVDSDPQIADALEQQWAFIAAALPDGARVLDLGCGNGAASLAMLKAARKAGISVSITAIDSAAIDPPRYVPEQAELLGQIEFQPQTRMETLPFVNDTFDLVISQFGLEYGNTREVLPEATRVLKPYGLLALLLLPGRGVAVQLANRNLTQCRYLLRNARIFDLAIQICRQMNEGEKGNPAGDFGSYMTPFNVEVEHVVRRFGAEDCDVVLAMVMGLQKVFINRKSTSVEEQIVAVQLLRTRLAEYAARAQALTRAALSESGFEELKRIVTASGLKLTGANPVLAGTHGAVAWRLTAERAIDA